MRTGTGALKPQLSNGITVDLRVERIYRRVRERARPAVDRARPTDICVCGHERAAHEHLRRGTDCALCPPGGCVRFRAAD